MNRITWIETIEKKARLETVDGYIGYVPKNGSLFDINTKKGHYFANLIVSYGKYINIFDLAKPKAKKLPVKEIDSIETF